MNSILCVYDIPQRLKVSNPSMRLRRYGFRVNLSCWVFPEGRVPVDEIDNLRDAGATVHLIEFSEQAQEKVLDLARAELRRHVKGVMKFTQERVGLLKEAIADAEHCPDIAAPDDIYKKWRSVLNRARRELLNAQQCALGFEITRDVDDALECLKNVLSGEFNLVLAWRAAHPANPKTLVPLEREGTAL